MRNLKRHQKSAHQDSGVSCANKLPEVDSEPEPESELAYTKLLVEEASKQLSSIPALGKRENSANQLETDGGSNLDGSSLLEPLESSKCKFCNKVLYDKHTLSRHIRHVHLKERNYSCQSCNKTFQEKSKWQNHLSKCSKPEQSISPNCSLETTISCDQSLVNFNSTPIGNAAPPSKSLSLNLSPVLGQPIRINLNQNRPIKTVSNQIARPEVQRPSNVNNHNEEKQNKQQAALTHVQQQQQPPQLKQQQQQQQQQQQLQQQQLPPEQQQQHIQQNSPSSNGLSFQCNFCDKLVASASNLKRHVSGVHLKERKSNCDFCQKSFFDNHSLKRHKKGVHSID
jgi:hypothetical protein